MKVHNYASSEVSIFLTNRSSKVAVVEDIMDDTEEVFISLYLVYYTSHNANPYDFTLLIRRIIIIS